MILRPRQRVFVDRVLEALRKDRRTLGVAPTGAGKTVMLSAAAAEFAERHAGARVLVLQHRGELVKQNLATFRAVTPTTPTSIWTADRKRWSRGATFAMVPTLCRPKSLDVMPAFDLIVADEAHHAVATTWQRIIARAEQLNPNVRVLGVTATPNRADGKGLGAAFDSVADVITIGELIRAGHLVPPRAMVIDVGVSAGLEALRRPRVGDYDMEAVAGLMDVEPVTSAVINHWRAQAGDRRTVVFCATVAHAEHVAASFEGAGIATEVVTGKMSKTDREAALKRIDRGKSQVLVNVAVATEGWDCPPVSCVVLLRPSSCESTMVQMIGRGLRIVRPDRYPGILKRDCIVLDFGRSLLTHGGIEQLVDLRGRPASDDGEDRVAPTKTCMECRQPVPIAAKTCPLCGYQWPAEVIEAAEVTQLADFRMIELDLLLEASPFRWWRMNARTQVCCAFDTWAVALEDLQGVWHAVGGLGKGSDREVHHLASGECLAALAAGDDWMRQHGDKKAASKNREWLTRPPSDKQLAIIRRMRGGAYLDAVTNRYEAACLITLKWQRRSVHACLIDTGALSAAA